MKDTANSCLASIPSSTKSGILTLYAALLSVNIPVTGNNTITNKSTGQLFGDRVFRQVLAPAAIMLQISVSRPICAIEKECRSPPISNKAVYVMMIRNNRISITVTGDEHTSITLDLSMYLIPTRSISTLLKALRITSAANNENTAHENEKMNLCSGSTARSIHTFLKKSVILLNSFFTIRIYSNSQIPCLFELPFYRSPGRLSLF